MGDVMENLLSAKISSQQLLIQSILKIATKITCARLNESMLRKYSDLEACEGLNESVSR